ncbi:TonB family protein [Steroidobacter denitrificans]|nr:TonB family protein [Steroidobacter denitrificans]
MRFSYPVVLSILLATVPCRSAIQTAHATERPESQQEYWAQVDQQDWTAAAAAAEKLVAATREKAPQHPQMLADVLILLAHAHLGRADYASAETAYQEALSIVQAHASATSSALIEPLRGLGYSLAGGNRDTEAIPYLQRALLIIHRNEGLFDLSQRGILQQLAISLTRSGQAAEAERQMQYLLKVDEHAYGRDDPRLAPTLVRIGSWYGEIGYFQIARAYYRQAISILEAALGSNDPALIEPLQVLAASYPRELLYSTLRRRTDRQRTLMSADGARNESVMLNPRYLDNEGETALRRALALLDMQPAPPADRLIEVLLQNGDWHQIKQQSEKALSYYRRAAALSRKEVPGTDTGIAADSRAMDISSLPTPLSFPVRVYYPMPLQATRHLALPADQVDETFVQIEFTVTRDGTVEDAKVTDHNGSARQASEALEAIKASRFRPRFVDGEPTETTGMRNREIFRTPKAESGD